MTRDSEERPLAANLVHRLFNTSAKIMPRFAILTHDHPELHWDLLLEKEAALRTWRLQRPPDEPSPIVALQLADHRKAYLDYEGPVSNNRGHVSRWDGGEMEWLLETPLSVRARLQGTRINGVIQLQATSDPDVWEFTCVAEPISTP